MRKEGRGKSGMGFVFFVSFVMKSILSLGKRDTICFDLVVYRDCEIRRGKIGDRRCGDLRFGAFCYTKNSIL